MQNIQHNAITMTQKLQFPEESRAVFADALDRIANNAVAAAWMTRLVAQYENSEGRCHYKRMLEDIRAMGEVLDIHPHTAEMLLFLCLGEPLRRRYEASGIDEKIYLDSMMDLRYKLEECRLVEGTVGSFVAPWFGGFFDMTRFALGRLQFEIVHTSKDFTVGGTPVPAGSPAINMHIPRTGTRLSHEEVMASYRAAAAWFADVFPDGNVLFTCSSWLLDPWHLTVLKPTSNLAAFIGDFEIVETKQYADYGELWRLFDCRYTGNPDDLPQDSSLRRAYADRVRRGEPTGSGRGFFRMRDGEIVSRA